MSDRIELTVKCAHSKHIVARVRATSEGRRLDVQEAAVRRYLGPFTRPDARPDPTTYTSSDRWAGEVVCGCPRMYPFSWGEAVRAINAGKKVIILTETLDDFRDPTHAIRDMRDQSR